MGKPPYVPPPEAWLYLPLDYYDLPIEERARALQIAGKELADDIFAGFFAKAAAAGSEEAHSAQ